MAIDFSALRKQRDMIDKILSLASDPEASSLLEKLVIEKKTEKSEITLRPAVVPRGAPRRAPRKAKGRNSQRGAQISAVRMAVAARSGQFTVGEIGADLRARGFDIKNLAVSRVLQRLAEKTHELHVAARGEGSNPNRYEKTEQFRAA